jgi:hypothetical protein
VTDEWSAGVGKRRVIPFVVLTALTLASTFTAWASSRPSTSSTIGPEGVAVYNVPDIAPASSTRTGAPVDGVSCVTRAKEVVKYHIHVHVSLYVDGHPRRLPAGIGITRPALVERTSSGDFYDVGLYDCLYWLHTHVADGIIHVEAPAKGDFTLGQFFDVWRQPLTGYEAGPAVGRVVVFENGRQLVGDPRATPLLRGADIQIDVGSPIVAYEPFPFRVTGGCGEGTTRCAPAAG